MDGLNYHKLAIGDEGGLRPFQQGPCPPRVAPLEEYDLQLWEDRDQP